MPSPAHPRREGRLSAVLASSAGTALCLFLAACSAGQRALDRGDAAYADGDFRGALGHYLDAERSGEDDDALATRLLNARIATAVEDGRKLYLEGKFEEALEIFRTALSLRPEDEGVRRWVLKVRRDLADVLVDQALEKSAESDFVSAEALLLEADRLWPGDAEAQEALIEVRTLAEWDRAKAQRYYEQGNRDLNANEVRVARWHFERTREFDEAHEGAARRLSQLDQPILDLRMGVIRTLIDSRRWHAAAAALRLLLERHPGYAVGEELLREMSHEAEATDLLEKARRARSRGDFEETKRLLERGRLLTQRQSEDFDFEARKLLSYELLASYLEGRKLEFEGRYDQAVTRFFGIVERVQSDPALLASTELERIPREKRYLLDSAFDPQEFMRKPEIWFTYARAQRALMDLRQRLSLAPGLYDEARRLEDAGQLAEARSLYRDLLIDLPSYRDTFERLRQVEVQLGISPSTVPALPDQGRVPKDISEEGLGEDGTSGN
jgi:tetratricopeptide (TPR) repeat protein